MNVIEQLKNDFHERDISTAKTYKRLIKLVEAEEEFMSSLTKEQCTKYLKLQNLDGLKHLDEIDEALEFGFKYTLQIIKNLIFYK